MFTVYIVDKVTKLIIYLVTIYEFFLFTSQLVLTVVQSFSDSVNTELIIIIFAEDYDSDIK